MDINLIVMDMDGTLLNANGVISQGNRNALIAAQERGIHLGIASGRHPDGLAHFAKELQMERHGGYLIGANGALLVHYPDMTKLFHHTIEPSLIRELFAFGLSHNIEVMAVHDHTIIDAIPNALMPLNYWWLLLLPLLLLLLFLRPNLKYELVDASGNKKTIRRHIFAKGDEDVFVDLNDKDMQNLVHVDLTVYKQLVKRQQGQKITFNLFKKPMKTIEVPDDMKDPIKDRIEL